MFFSEHSVVCPWRMHSFGENGEGKLRGMHRTDCTWPELSKSESNACT